MDGELTSRIAAGDESALAEAFRVHGGAVKALARRVLGDESLADDVVQETFVWLWGAADRYEPGRGSLRSMLLTVAHRRAVDLIRSEEARTRREARLPDPPYDDVADQAMAADVSERVRRALGDLSGPERAAIALAYFGGLTYVEVSRRLGAPEGTVKSRIRNGMRKLAAALDGVAS